MPNKYYVIDDNGFEHKRTSKSRTYTHTVLFQDSPEYALRMAERLDPYGNDSNHYDYMVSIAEGKTWYAHFTQRNMDAAKAVTCLSKDEYCRGKRAERVRRVETDINNGLYGQWGNAGWCGRRDLAEKLLLKYTGERYRRAVIKEAIEK